MTIPERSEIVIIGGGVIGCSIAYHLAQRGETDVTLVERKQLTNGSTWHAAGLVGQLRSSSNLTQLMRKSVETYQATGGEDRVCHRLARRRQPAGRLQRRPLGGAEARSARRARASASTSTWCRRRRPGNSSRC